MSKKSSEPSSSQTTNSKTKSKDDTRLKHTPSEVTINDERMFSNLEELMTYIGSSFPHYRHTVLPIYIVYFFIYFFSRFLYETRKMIVPEVMNNNGTHEDFYSKCYDNSEDDLIKVSEKADILKSHVPRGEITLVTNMFFMFALTTVSPRKLVLTCLGVTSFAYFVMAHFKSQMQMSMHISQIFTEVFSVVIAVTVAESVPKFHRMPALILLELVRISSQTFITIFIRLPSDIESVQMTYCLEVFGFLTLVLAFVVYYTFHDSLHNLLARSKSDRMQDRVTAIFEKADIHLAPDAVIDQIAFENFENNHNAIEVLVKTLKTFKLIQEVLVCGLISGACLAVNAFVEAETNKHAEVMFFEKSLIPGTTYTISSILLIIISFLMPKKRVLPVIILIPILFVVTSAIYLIPHAPSFKTYDKCSQHYIVKKDIFPIYLSIGVLTSALTDMIRFLVKMHLIEVMPALIRSPVVAVLQFVQYSFDGNVRYLYSNESIGGEAILVLISIIAMLVLLIRPRKKNDMNVFFSEYTNIDKQRVIPPAPVIMN
ncbi:unnamed protein product [Caenorhabditis brenneri]